MPGSGRPKIEDSPLSTTRWACAEFGSVSLQELIKMCSGELMQELVLRLGGAADHGAYTQTVRALNTLIPVAMANSSAEADEAGDGMLSGQVLQP